MTNKLWMVYDMSGFLTGIFKNKKKARDNARMCSILYSKVPVRVISARVDWYLRGEKVDEAEAEVFFDEKNQCVGLTWDKEASDKLNREYRESKKLDGKGTLDTQSNKV